MTEDKNYMKAIVDIQLNLSAINGLTAEKVFGKPGRTIVSMGQGKVVEASPQDTEVFTYGVIGCSVVAIEGTRKGKRFGAITHYDPLSLEDNLQKIRKLGNYIGQAGTKEETNAELFVRGSWEQIDGNWKIKPDNVEEAIRLTRAVKKAFGHTTSVTVTPYSETQDLSKKSQGQVSIDISSQPQGKKRILGYF